jgi:hypothetical protein
VLSTSTCSFTGLEGKDLRGHAQPDRVDGLLALMAAGTVHGEATGTQPVLRHNGASDSKLMISMHRLIVAAILIGGLGAGRLPAQQPVNPQAAALKEFADRTKAYVDLKTRMKSALPPLGANATPVEISRHEQQLASAIRRARSNARQGDIFTPPVVPQFRTIIRRDLQSRDIRDALAAMQEVPYTVTLRVNDGWPSDFPLATIPARLLNNLYPLPDGLEYRFLDRHLVLLDTESKLIVDFVRDVVPSIVRRRR